MFSDFFIFYLNCCLSLFLICKTVYGSAFNSVMKKNEKRDGKCRKKQQPGADLFLSIWFCYSLSSSTQYYIGRHGIECCRYTGKESSITQCHVSLMNMKSFFWGRKMEKEKKLKHFNLNSSLSTLSRQIK